MNLLQNLMESLLEIYRPDTKLLTFVNVLSQVRRRKH